LAAIAENTIPIRGKPGKVALKYLSCVLWVRKLCPFAGKSTGEFTHGPQ